MATTKKAAAKKAAAKPVISESARKIGKAAEEEILDQTIEEAKTDPAPPKNISPIRPGDMIAEALLHNRWAVVLPAEYTAEDLEEKSLWKFMGPKLQELDEVRVSADNCSWVAKGYVINAVGSDVRIKFHTWIELEARTEREIEINGYFVRNGGLAKRYYVVHKDTGTEILSGIPTMVEAIRELQDYLKAA